MLVCIGNRFQRLIGISPPLIKAEHLTFVVNCFDTRERPSLVLALYNAKSSTVKATIEGLRLGDWSPTTIGARQKALFELQSLFFFQLAISLLLLSPEPLVLPLKVLLKHSDDGTHLGTLHLFRMIKRQTAILEFLIGIARVGLFPDCAQTLFDVCLGQQRTGQIV